MPMTLRWTMRLGSLKADKIQLIIDYLMQCAANGWRSGSMISGCSGNHIGGALEKKPTDSSSGRGGFFFIAVVAMRDILFVYCEFVLSGSDREIGVSHDLVLRNTFQIMYDSDLTAPADMRSTMILCSCVGISLEARIPDSKLTLIRKT